ncbi:hypothetical protein ACJJIE_11935 [Microbulbifer sp. TRSA001]|uniref:hypothetical protein n=1 Tax=Microbulbifer sp. TRSA001 TaxID=3243381 RepID=UPI00403918E0
MEQFILILTLSFAPNSADSGASIAMVEFDSKQACEAAAAEWKRQVVARFPIKMRTEQALVALCMPKK